MTPREQAEQVTHFIMGGKEEPMCGQNRLCPDCSTMADSIEAAILNARREALLEAAGSVVMLSNIYGERIPARGISGWLRARAAEQKEPQT